ncbi:hypothetical protein Lalb_Chr00c23g0406321 [Lupinus albus]|uniref:Uncharacterized protein n=1 Tax=Lupinus albus TaxID=3870 RepID=A0A6A4N9V5_LUPAL|nr:hypothetical protein Lalb_Chr00c23g0406321 [Lupinus albus]
MSFPKIRKWVWTMFLELFYCRSSRNIIHKHFPELRPCKVEAFTSNDFQPTCGTIHDALTDTCAMAWVSVP